MFKIQITLLVVLIYSISTFSQSSNSRIFKTTANEGNWHYSEQDSMYINYAYSDTIFSPNLKYKVIMRALGIQDQCSQLTYWIVINDTIKEKIMTAIIRDNPAPNFFWIGNEYLLYEYKNKHEATQIYLRNLQKNKIEFMTEGCLLVKQEDADNFYDPINQILIFYKNKKENNNYKTDLMKLDIKKKLTAYLYTMKSNNNDFDNPVVSLDWTERKLFLNYQDFYGQVYREDIKY